MSALFLRLRVGLGVRAQLVVWYTALFGLILLVAAGIFYGAFRVVLELQVDQAVHTRADQIAAHLTHDGSTLMVLPTSGSGSASTPLQAASDTSVATVVYGQSDALVRILNTSGAVVYQTPSMHSVTLPTESVSAPLSGGVWEDTIRLSGISFAHVYARPLKDGKQVFGVVQVGQSLDLATTTAGVSAVVLLALTPLILAAGAGGAFWLAGLAFRPVRRLTAAARAVQPGDLGRRVPVPAPQDELRDLAQTFNAMLARLDAAFVAQRRFIADASHDLRSPVAAMKSLAENGRDGVGSQDPKVALDNIAHQSERLSRLLTNLLALARLDEGQGQQEWELVRLDTLVEDVVESLRPLIERRGIALLVDAEKPLTVEGDFAQLLLAVSTIIDNALTYTASGGSVHASIELSGPRSVRITVRDTGIGISGDDLPHIFERFYRADRARGHAEGGSGLGLAIAQAIITAHGGSIIASSELTVGSTFAITLPVATNAAV